MAPDLADVGNDVANDVSWDNRQAKTLCKAVPIWRLPCNSLDRVPALLFGRGNIYAFHCLGRSGHRRGDRANWFRWGGGPGVTEDLQEQATDPLLRQGQVPNRIMNILAVDDEPFILELIPKIAAKAGYSEVTTAATGLQALDIVQNSGRIYDCLVFDINMPGMDGIELCTRVRALPGYSKSPVIMLTAMKVLVYLDRAFKAGATDYTAKPFDIIAFGERLRIVETQLIDQRTQVGTASKVGSIQLDGLRVHRFDLSDALTISGGNDLIDYAALQIYLTRFSRTAVEVAYVMAVSVDQIEELYSQTSSAGFVQALTQVAAAIDEVFKPYGYAMSYAGHGQFIIVSNGVTLPLATDKEAEILVRLQKMALDRDRQTDREITVSVGNPVRPGSGRAERAKVAFETAINLAEGRAAGKLAAVQPRGLRGLGQ